MATKTLSGYRLVNTRRGDTLQRVAARELGAAGRWYELAEINNLRPPYLTDDANAVTLQVKLTGSQLIVPSSSPQATADTSVDAVFGADIKLKNGRLQADESGDIRIISGVDNYVQALRFLLATEPGDLLFHPNYGCGVRSIIGASNSRAKMMLAGGLVRRAIAADPRTQAVPAATVTARGDAIRIEVTATAIHDQPVRLSEAL